MPKVNPMISDQSAEFYASNFKSRNGGCEYALDAWPTLYKRTLYKLRGNFTGKELNLIIDVFNATMLSPAMAGQHLEASVSDAIELDGLDKKYTIDGTRLVTKINELSIFEAACLEVWANTYWYGKSDKKRPNLDEYISAMV